MSWGCIEVAVIICHILQRDVPLLLTHDRIRVVPHFPLLHDLTLARCFKVRDRLRAWQTLRKVCLDESDGLRARIYLTSINLACLLFCRLLAPIRCVNRNSSCSWCLALQIGAKVNKAVSTTAIGIQVVVVKFVVCDGALDVVLAARSDSGWMDRVVFKHSVHDSLNGLPLVILVIRCDFKPRNPL